MSDIILTPDDAGVPLQVGRADCKSCGGSAIVRPEGGAPVAGAESFAGVTNFVDALRWVRDNRRKTIICSLPSFDVGPFSVRGDITTATKFSILRITAPVNARLYSYTYNNDIHGCGPPPYHGFTEASSKDLHMWASNYSSDPTFDIYVRGIHVKVALEAKPNETCGDIRYERPSVPYQPQDYYINKRVRSNQGFGSNMTHYVTLDLPYYTSYAYFVNVTNVVNSRSNGRTQYVGYNVAGPRMHLEFYTSKGAHSKSYAWMEFSIEFSAKATGCA